MRFFQVDVFGKTPLAGNPVAVVLDADGLSNEHMQSFARWTNLSETTFVTTPNSPEADYAVRIFTPARELPFAGHPTLGTAHAWLEAGGVPHSAGVIVQECAAGLIEISRRETLAFLAPPVVRTGPLEPHLVTDIASALGVEEEQILSHQWVDNGPGWAAVEVATPELLLGLTPHFSASSSLNLGVFAMHAPTANIAYDIRAFVPRAGVAEDPVTGSLNASVAQWLARTGRVPAQYEVRQGTCLQRDGRLHIRIEHAPSSTDGADNGRIWVGGATHTLITGTVNM